MCIGNTSWLDDLENPINEKDEGESVESQLRKPKSLQRKIARAVGQNFEWHSNFDAAEIHEMEKDLAKVIKRVITAHNKGK